MKQLIINIIGTIVIVVVTIVKIPFAIIGGIFDGFSREKNNDLRVENPESGDAKDKKHVKEMADFINILASEVNFLEPNQVHELFDSVTSRHFERVPEDAKYTPSDCVFNLLIPNIGEMTQEDALERYISLQMWREVDHFLLHAPVYKTSIVSSGMQYWESILIKKGIDPMNFKMML